MNKRDLAWLLLVVVLFVVWLLLVAPASVPTFLH